MDAGIGIAADQLPRIFDMFTQIDASLERSVSGLGIGLTLVKSLMEMHGGTVEVSSAGLGQGSELVVRLPVFAVVVGIIHCGHQSCDRIERQFFSAVSKYGFCFGVV